MDFNLDNDPTITSFRTLLFTVRRIRRTMKMLFRSYDLTGAQFSTLTRIPPEGISLTRLADLSRADPGNLSGIVDRLEEKGWVERRRSLKDRRVVQVLLLPDGKEVLKQIVPEYKKTVYAVMKRLKPEDRKMLDELMGKLEENITSEVVHKLK